MAETMSTLNGYEITDQNARNMLSDAYSNTATYKVGDLCIHESTIYECITAVTAAEDFNTAKWKATSINTILKERFPYNIVIDDEAQTIDFIDR